MLKRSYTRQRSTSTNWTNDKASEKQIRYIKRIYSARNTALMTSEGIEVPTDIDFDTLTKGEAADIIGKGKPLAELCTRIVNAERYAENSRAM